MKLYRYGLMLTLAASLFASEEKPKASITAKIIMPEDSESNKPDIASKALPPLQNQEICAGGVCKHAVKRTQPPTLAELKQRVEQQKEKQTPGELVCSGGVCKRVAKSTTPPTLTELKERAEAQRTKEHQSGDIECSGGICKRTVKKTQPPTLAELKERMEEARKKKEPQQAPK